MKKLIKKIIVLSMVCMYVTTNSYLVHAEMIAQPYLEGKNTSAEEKIKQENSEAVDDTKQENAEAVDSTKQESTEAVDSTKQENSEAVDGTKQENAESVDSTKQENAEVVDSTKQESTESVNSVKQENTVKSSGAFNISDWEIDREDKDSITLYWYRGSATDIVVPGEYNGKQIILRDLQHFPSNMTSLKLEEVNGKKVKVKNYLYNKPTGNGTSYSVQGLMEYKQVETMDLKGLDVSSFEDVGNTLNNMFRYCEKLRSVDVSGWNLSNKVDLSGMFSFCKELRSIIGLNTWNVSNITNMNMMFYNASSIENIHGISNWNTSSVTSMGSMFENASNLKNLDLSNWNVFNVTNMGSMFERTSSLTNIGDIGDWNVLNVTNMSNMFAWARSLRNIGDIGKWNVSNVTNMQYMFNSSSLGKSLENIGEWNVSKVTNMDSMFALVRNLKSLDLSNWNVSKVTNMSYMFWSASSLTNIGDIGNWDVSNVTNMSYMFRNIAVKNLNLSNWNTSKVTNMDSMFGENNSLEWLDLSNWDVSNVTSINYIFDRTPNLKWIDLSNWNLSKVTSMINICRVVGSKTQLLIVTKDQKLKEYNYLNDGRIPTGPTFNANGGVFPDGSTTNSPFKTFVLENNSDEAINKILEEAIGKVSIPTKSGATFIEWEKRSSKVVDDVYDKLSAEYYAKWNTPPVINAEDKVLTVGDSFNPLDGVTAEDPEDGPITIKKEDVVSNVDTKVAGEYTVTYMVTDKHGMSTIKTIKVVVIPKGVVDVEGNGEWGVVIPMSINFTKESQTVDADIKLVGLGNTKLSDFKTLEVDGTVKSENAYKMIGEGNAKDNTASYTYQLNNNKEFAANKSEQAISRLNLTAPKQDGIATLTNGGSKKGKYKDMLTFKFTAVKVEKKQN